MNPEAVARRVAETAYGLKLTEPPRPSIDGRVNLTFFLVTATGPFVLQRLHPIFGTDGAVVENMAAVAEALAGAGLPAPRVARTVSGRLWARDGGLWRLSLRLPGTAGEDRTPERVGEAARFLARFHQVLAGVPLDLRPLPLAEHNRNGPSPPDIWQGLEDLYRGSDRFGPAAPALARGRALAEAAPSIPMVTQAVLHGDPKMENFLFDGRGRLTGLIDLDTVRRGPLLWEMADALRSWAGLRQAGDEVVLDAAVFEAAISSYRRHGPALTVEEWRILPAVVGVRALELARRYLMDYFEESYFAWDRRRYASLAEQNLIRGRGLLRLVADLFPGTT